MFLTIERFTVENHTTGIVQMPRRRQRLFLKKQTTQEMGHITFSQTLCTTNNLKEFEHTENYSQICDSKMCRCLTIGRSVHETGNNKSKPLCCVQLLFLDLFIESRNGAL